MTEKLFTLSEVGCYRTSLIVDDGRKMGNKEVVDVLNHLHEENIQLKHCLKKIEKELREYNELIWNNEVKEMYPLKEEGKQYRS